MSWTLTTPDLLKSALQHALAAPPTLAGAHTDPRPRNAPPPGHAVWAVIVHVAPIQQAPRAMQGCGEQVIPEPTKKRPNASQSVADMMTQPAVCTPQQAPVQVHGPAR